MARLSIEGLCKGWDFPVLDELDLELEEGEFFIVVGPSGAGKTTLLRLVAGLETADAGRIVLNGEDVTTVPPYRRGIAMTFESYALYPNMTVFKNIASPLVARKLDRHTIEQKVTAVAKLLQIDQLLDRKPGEISGGQKQRTALGRTLVADPKAYLLDEPISHLDAKIRHELREQFQTLEALRTVGTLYVTHDYSEALALGDRIGVMGGGKLVQTGTPRELFDFPSHAFVAQQLGQPGINLLMTSLTEDGGKTYLRSRDGNLKLLLNDEQRQRLDGRSGSEVLLGIRPQHIRILAPRQKAPAKHQMVDARIEQFQPLGSMGIAITRAHGIDLKALTPPEAAHIDAQEVRLAIFSSAFHLFDPISGKRI